jgi:hypothetical protein
MPVGTPIRPWLTIRPDRVLIESKKILFSTPVKG